MLAVLLLASADQFLPLLDVGVDGLEILGGVEAGLFEVVKQTLNCANSAIDSRRFLIAADGQEEKGDKLEAIVQHCVDAVLLIALVYADSVERFHLRHELVVVLHDILALHVGRTVLFEDREAVAEGEDLVEDGLLCRVERDVRHGGVCHDGQGDEGVLWIPRWCLWCE